MSLVPSPRVALVALALAAVVAQSAGCSAVRMGLYLSGTSLGESYPVGVIPDGPVEERVVVVEEPPPALVVEVAPEPPPPAVVVPEPPPPPPPCLCERQQRYEHELVIKGTRQFGTVERILLGMVALFDGAVAFAAYSDVAQHGALDEETWVPATVGTVLAADALALLAIIAFMPEVDTEEETRQPGTFRPVERFPCACGPTDTAGACPSGHTDAPPT